MNVQTGIGMHHIGEWSFHAASGELRRGAEVRRLEPRAARTLELLCAARGSVVSQEQLIQVVWNGRSLSENSVAVVVGQLRKALDDDARDPKLIETIPKRGYRLVDQASPLPRQRSRQRLGLAIIVVAILAIAAAIGLRGMTGQADIAMTDIANQTGDPSYDPLTRATTELMLAELSKRGFDVERGTRGRMVMTGKLVMWNGAPYLGLSATDAAGVVRWSAMAKATPETAPAGLHKELDDFQSKIPR